MKGSVVRDTFNKAAKDYDKIKVQIVPKYREVETLIQGYLRFPKSRHLSILELGTGTGKWASGILGAFPNAHYHGIDFSEQMLKMAAERLKRYACRVLLENLDLNQQIPTGKFDLIYSMFAIHHIHNKHGFFNNLRTLLKPNGLFLYVDITVASSQDLEELFLDNWKVFMRKSPWPNHRIKRIIDDHLENDLPETVEIQMQYLREVGFKSCDLIWRYEKFAAFHAKN